MLGILILCAALMIGVLSGYIIRLKSHESGQIDTLNAGILSAQMLSTNNEELFNKTVNYKETLKQKIVKANTELKKEKFKFRVN